MNVETMQVAVYTKLEGALRRMLLSRILEQRDIEAQEIAGRCGIANIDLSGGTIDIDVRPPEEIADLFRVLIEWADSVAGPNYVEQSGMIRVKPAGHWQPWTVYAVRPDGKTPHQLRLEAEARVAELEAQLAEAAR